MNITSIGTDQSISPTLRTYAERVLRAALHELRRDILHTTVRFMASGEGAGRYARSCQIVVDTRAAKPIVVEASADNFYAALHDAVARLDSALLQEQARKQFFTAHPSRGERSSRSPLVHSRFHSFSAGEQKTLATGA